jgi:hypothetical protein
MFEKGNIDEIWMDLEIKRKSSIISANLIPRRPGRVAGDYPPEIGDRWLKISFGMCQRKPPVSVTPKGRIWPVGAGLRPAQILPSKVNG